MGMESVIHCNALEVAYLLSMTLQNNIEKGQPLALKPEDTKKLHLVNKSATD